jgi:hypothetical protein
MSIFFYIGFPIGVIGGVIAFGIGSMLGFPVIIAGAFIAIISIWED